MLTRRTILNRFSSDQAWEAYKGELKCELETLDSLGEEIICDTICLREMLKDLLHALENK